jgi:hypothetical protein
MHRFSMFPLATLLGLATLGAGEGQAAVPEVVRFNQHVRPILSNNCFYCHGPDPKHREAELRLDDREAAIEYGAIVPGEPDQSTLIERVGHDDPEQQMPPPHSKKPRLSDEQIAILRKWIEQGAEYEGHWAFLPLAAAEPPPVKDASWPRNAIDRFILARLEQEGLAPSPEADRATLIRRVYLDLLGLLPAPAEVAAFVDDPDPAGYENLVAGLLASPHYGERWGRHWLDHARYADSNGYTIDSERSMWPYRDWVIQALNDDMPFDRFTIEQLAGDLLPQANKSQLVATAFHRNTLINEEGGTDPEQFRHEAVVDRVNTTGAVWLGLTVACAQCHTHKFDPLTHREYYELFAFFNQTADVNSRGATVSVARAEMFGVPPPPLPSTLSEAELAQRQAAWEKSQLAAIDSAPAAAAWKPAEYVEYGAASGAVFRPLEDGSLLAEGPIGPHDVYRIVARTDLPQVAAVRLRALTHESLPKMGPGRAGNGNFVLTDFAVSIAGAKLPIASAFADHEQPRFPITGALDGDPKSGWAINVAAGAKAVMNADHEAVFVFEKPLAAANEPFEFTLSHGLHADYLIGRLAIDFADTAPAPPVTRDEAIVALLRTEAGKRTPEQTKSLRSAFEQSDPVAIAAKKAREDAAARLAPVMIMAKVARPRETFIYQRGDFLRPDKETGPLAPGVPAFLSPGLPEQTEHTRLDLARWLVSGENPLPPRVTMNRVWLRYFGRGLVETEEDFGTQGTLPTHPELLDWLSREFIRRGWSLKEMHRLIVVSSVYRQSSKARPELRDKDPRNLLLARQERVRVEAEVVRDAALSASGLLTPAIGGPGVRPPQPEGVYAFTQNAKPWNPTQGSDRYRRAMYTVFYRSAPHPMFTTFDAPDFQTVCTRRIRSNTPLQALTVANDEAFVEFAQGVAARVERETATADVGEKIKLAFLLALSREPSAKELDLLRSYYQRQLAGFASDPAGAKSFLSAGLSPGEVSPEAAALTCVCRTILNTDGFITRE